MTCGEEVGEGTKMVGSSGVEAGEEMAVVVARRDMMRAWQHVQVRETLGASCGDHWISPTHTRPPRQIKAEAGAAEAETAVAGAATAEAGVAEAGTAEAGVAEAGVVTAEEAGVAIAEAGVAIAEAGVVTAEEAGAQAGGGAPPDSSSLPSSNPALAV